MTHKTIKNTLLIFVNDDKYDFHPRLCQTNELIFLLDLLVHKEKFVVVYIKLAKLFEQCVGFCVFFFFYLKSSAVQLLIFSMVVLVDVMILI